MLLKALHSRDIVRLRRRNCSARQHAASRVRPSPDAARPPSRRPARRPRKMAGDPVLRGRRPEIGSATAVATGGDPGRRGAPGLASGSIDSRGRRARFHNSWLGRSTPAARSASDSIDAGALICLLHSTPRAFHASSHFRAPTFPHLDAFCSIAFLGRAHEPRVLCVCCCFKVERDEFAMQFLPARGATVHPMPATPGPAHSKSVQLSSARGNCRSGYRRERPNREAAAAWRRRPPPLTSFGATRAARSDVSAPTPWLTRPGLSRATPFNVARPDAPSPHVAQPEYTGRNGRRNLLGRCDTMPSRSNPSQPCLLYTSPSPRDS